MSTPATIAKISEVVRTVSTIADQKSGNVSLGRAMISAPSAPIPAASVGVAKPVYMLPITSRMITIMPQMPLSERRRSGQVIPSTDGPNAGLSLNRISSMIT